ncbi:hypothetical protein F5Y19DRAFT_486584 [Xylariaceae sp. FL1651]|nr:hypothetical protein F5Y19DRAFT_486584 [Xylariaceae sp. FL1651]
MSQLPAGTLGDAVGVLIYTFTCLFLNVIIIWLYWINQDRLGYIALIAYFALLCTVSSIVQQIYNYTYWNDLLWAQLYYIKANYKNADVAFNNGVFGFQRVLAIIRLYCYTVESSFFLSYTIHVTLTIHGCWTGNRRAEQSFAVYSKLIPIVLAAITIGLLQTPPVQSSFLVYMVVANVQAVTSCAVSILLMVHILWEYIKMKRSWRSLGSSVSGRSWRSIFKGRSTPSTESSVSQTNVARPVMFDNNLLIFRLSIGILLITVFILAQIITHLPQRDDIARDSQADAPDLSAGRARSNIIGYIYGVTPGLAIFIVFGLTRESRQIMYEKLIPKPWRWNGLRRRQRPRSQRSWPPSPDLMNDSAASRPLQIKSTRYTELQAHPGGLHTRTSASPEFIGTPLIVFDSLESRDELIPKSPPVIRGRG